MGTKSAELRARTSCTSLIKDLRATLPFWALCLPANATPIIFTTRGPAAPQPLWIYQEEPKGNSRHASVPV